MTKIGFYILDNADEASRITLALRLTDKAFQRGHRVFIHCESNDQARELDQRLWSFRPASFLPHALCTTDGAEQEPIAIGWDQAPKAHDDLLINMCPEIPGFFARFQRVAELVNQEPDRLRALRESYRYYRDRGYAIEQHRLAGV
ncbi:MAG: DNA polymerase III subunit chi [Pseudomonadota bacterium]